MEKYRIKMIHDNLEEGHGRYKRGEITLEQWERIKKDARKRISELRQEAENDTLLRKLQRQQSNQDGRNTAF